MQIKNQVKIHRQLKERDIKRIGPFLALRELAMAFKREQDKIYGSPTVEIDKNEERKFKNILKKQDFSNSALLTFWTRIFFFALMFSLLEARSSLSTVTNKIVYSHCQAFSEQPIFFLVQDQYFKHLLPFLLLMNPPYPTQPPTSHHFSQRPKKG